MEESRARKRFGCGSCPLLCQPKGASILPSPAIPQLCCRGRGRPTFGLCNRDPIFSPSCCSSRRQSTSTPSLRDGLKASTASKQGKHTGQTLIFPISWVFGAKMLVMVLLKPGLPTNAETIKITYSQCCHLREESRHSCSLTVIDAVQGGTKTFHNSGQPGTSVP